eukprot:352598-Chlamydomonas_euryale.AAC.13
MLDGRINVHQPPPTSIASMSTASMSSEVREATMRRIQGLESELEAARKERIMLESNVSMLRTGKSPHGLATSAMLSIHFVRLLHYTCNTRGKSEGDECCMTCWPGLAAVKQTCVSKVVCSFKQAYAWSCSPSLRIGLHQGLLQPLFCTAVACCMRLVYLLHSGMCQLCEDRPFGRIHTFWSSMPHTIQQQSSMWNCVWNLSRGSEMSPEAGAEVSSSCRDWGCLNKCSNVKSKAINPHHPDVQTHCTSVKATCKMLMRGLRAHGHDA